MILSSALILVIIWALNRSQCVLWFLLSVCFAHCWTLTVVNILNSQIKLLFSCVFAGIANIFDLWIFLVHRLRCPSDGEDSLRVSIKLNIFKILLFLNHQIIVHNWLVLTLQIHHWIQRLTIDSIIDNLIIWNDFHVCLWRIGLTLIHITSDFALSITLLELMRFICYVGFCMLHFIFICYLFLVLVNVRRESYRICECHFNRSVVHHVN